MTTAPAPNADLTRDGLRFAVLMAALENGMFSFVFLAFMNSYLLEELHAGPAAPGYTLAAYSAIVLVMNTLAGALLDRFAPSRILTAVVSAQLAATAILFAASSFAGFLAATVLLALGAGAVWPLIFQVLGSTQPLGQRAGAGAAISIAGYATTGGGLGAGVLLGALAPPWASLAVIGVVAVAPTYWLRSHVLASSRNGTPESAGAIPKAGAGTAPSRQPDSPRRARGIRAIAALIFLSYGARAAIAGVYGPYSQFSLGQSLLATAPYLAPAGVLALATLWLVPRWSRPERRQAELTGLFAAAAIGAGLVAMAPNPLTAGIAAVPLIVGITACAPLLAATVLDVGTGNNSGLIFGSLLTIEGIGTVSMRALAALAIDLSGPRAGFWAVALMFAVLTLLAPFAPGAEQGEA